MLRPERIATGTNACPGRHDEHWKLTKMTDTGAHWCGMGSPGPRARWLFRLRTFQTSTMSARSPPVTYSMTIPRYRVVRNTCSGGPGCEREHRPCFAG